MVHLATVDTFLASPMSQHSASFLCRGRQNFYHGWWALAVPFDPRPGCLLALESQSQTLVVSLDSLRIGKSTLQGRLRDVPQVCRVQLQTGASAATWLGTWLRDGGCLRR